MMQAWADFLDQLKIAAPVGKPTQPTPRRKESSGVREPSATYGEDAQTYAALASHPVAAWG
jgi:hypothetical protein